MGWISLRVKTPLESFLVYLPLATKLGQGNVFTGICDSVNRVGGCLVPGGSAPGGVPGLGGCLVPGDVCSGGCLVETPPGRPLLRAVRILLECILVFSDNTLSCQVIISKYYNLCTFLSNLEKTFQTTYLMSFFVMPAGFVCTYRSSCCTSCSSGMVLSPCCAPTVVSACSATSSVFTPPAASANLSESRLESPSFSYKLISTRRFNGPVVKKV